MKTFRKQPNDHLDYQITLTDWLVEGDEIETVDCEAPPGIELTNIGIMPDRIKLWIKGGETGKSYRFSPKIHTRHRTREVDFLIVVVES